MVRASVNKNRLSDSLKVDNVLNEAQKGIKRFVYGACWKALGGKEFWTAHEDIYDLAQLVFIELHNRSIDVETATASPELFSYIHKIVQSRLIDGIRREKVKERSYEKIVNNTSPTEKELDQILAIRCALEQLSSEERGLVLLHIAGHTIDEISEMSLIAIGRHLKRGNAHKKLKSALSKIVSLCCENDGSKSKKRKKQS